MPCDFSELSAQQYNTLFTQYSLSAQWDPEPSKTVGCKQDLKVKGLTRDGRNANDHDKLNSEEITEPAPKIKVLTKS